MSHGGRRCRAETSFADEANPYPVLVVNAERAEDLPLAPDSISVVVAGATDVPAALAAIRSTPCCCALLDLRRPGLDGAGVLSEARREGLSVPIIGLAGRADEELATELRGLGAWDCVTESDLSSERLRQAVAQAARLRHAELFGRAERQRLMRLQTFTAAVATKRTVADVAEATTAELQLAFAAPRALFCVVDDDGDTIQVVRVDGFPEAVIEPWRELPMSSPLPLAEALRQAVPLFFEDSAALMARYPHLLEHRVQGDEALMVLPLVVERRAIGAVSLIYDRARRISDEDRTELNVLAQVCAQALDRAYLLEVAQRERRRAEEANRAKDEFLAVVSHELRTPLNAILGWSTMLNAGTLSADQSQRATQTIERNARAQAQLIEDLLDVSRIITGNMRLKAEPVDLALVIEAALEIVRPAADAKGVTLEQRFEQPVAPLLGDGDRLQQVFWNLLSNAVKFTPRGGSVEVALARAEPHFVVQVHDSGQGIPTSFLPHVFQRFRQLDASSTRKTGGLGLGLAIVRHLVELHGGQVEVASEGEGKGSVLTVRLPIGAELRRAPSEPPSISERGATMIRRTARAGRSSLTGIRVLVVDDDVDARELVAAVLVEHGAQVTAAAAAGEALERLLDERHDVLISDIGMPVEDGYVLMERVRALPPSQGGRTPAIALTAYAHNSDRAKALLAGYTAHATKPIDPVELIQIIHSILGKRADAASS